jgi:hypothetical protein
MYDGLLDELSGFEARDPAPAEPDDAILARCNASFAYSAFKNIYGYDVEPQPHLEVAEFIDTAMGDYSFSTGEQRLYMVGLPRHTYKTTLFAQGLPSLTLGRNPNARVLISSFRHDISKKRLRAVKQDLEFNQRFHAWFGDGWKPEFREDVWNDDSIYVMRRTDKTLIDPSIACAGLDRSMTGGHFDLIIGDDFVTDTNIRTKQMRDKVYDYILDLLPILSPTGVLVLIFTRWHTDDAYGRLIRADAQRVREKERPFFTKIIHKCHNPDGTLFFPSVLTESFLRDQRERMGSRKFEAQYNNEPIADEDRTFAMERSRVRAFDFLARRTGGGYVVLPGRGQMPVLTTGAWDPAGRIATATSDSHGITVCGTDMADLRWVCEALSYKGKPTEVVNAVINLILFYKLWALSIEQDGGGGMWQELLCVELDRRGIPRIYIYEYRTGGVPKNVRIATAVQPRWERGGYILRPQHHVLLNQIESFSISAQQEHEDVLDSLAQHEEFARIPESWQREDDNPIDPEYQRYQKTFGAGAYDRPGSRAGTQWDVTGRPSLTPGGRTAYDNRDYPV